MSQHPPHTDAVPVYALSRTGAPLIAASLHPAGAKAALKRARAAGAEVSPDGKMVDGEWLRGDIRLTQPALVPLLSALLIAVVQQGMLLNEVQQMRKGDAPSVTH